MRVGRLSAFGLQASAFGFLPSGFRLYYKPPTPDGRVMSDITVPSN
jgi:hypothetical protein